MTCATHVTELRHVTRLASLAFTLAEVLIVLGILGLIADMTIPTLISSTQEKITVTKLKKIYSLINQSITMAIPKYGTIDEWGLVATTHDTSDPENPVYSDETIASSDKFMFIITENLKVIERKSYADYGKTGMYGGEASIKLAEGTRIEGLSIAWPSCTASVGGLQSEKNICGDIYFTLDKKEPVSGKNVFSFWITKNGLIPKGTPDATHQTFENNCLGPGTEEKRGCTAWVLYNENMDYLHCRDLSWSGKKSCD